MILSEKLLLHNEISIPRITFGTLQISNDRVTDAVKSALSVGYRHIDTAAAYENEWGVGKALRESGLRREEGFITTKIPAEVKTYEGAKAMIAASLKNLETSYIDLMLIHAPKPWEELLGHPIITEIAEKYQVSVPQLSIRYDYQLGLIPLPRSTNPVHISENKNIDFVISDTDMKRLSQIEEIQNLNL